MFAMRPSVNCYDVIINRTNFLSLLKISNASATFSDDHSDMI